MEIILLPRENYFCWQMCTTFKWREHLFIKESSTVSNYTVIFFNAKLVTRIAFFRLALSRCVGNSRNCKPNTSGNQLGSNLQTLRFLSFPACCQGKVEGKNPLFCLILKIVIESQFQLLEEKGRNYFSDLRVLIAAIWRDFWSNMRMHLFELGNGWAESRH